MVEGRDPVTYLDIPFNSLQYSIFCNMGRRCCKKSPDFINSAAEIIAASCTWSATT